MTRITLTAIIAAATLTACTASPEMIEAQKDRCTAVGYQPGTPEHAQCTERGTTQQQQMQNAMLGVGAGTASGAAIGALFY